MAHVCPINCLVNTAIVRIKQATCCRTALQLYHPSPRVCHVCCIPRPTVYAVNPDGIFLDISILLGMVITIIVSIIASGWKMTRTVGSVEVLCSA